MIGRLRGLRRRTRHRRERFRGVHRAGMQEGATDAGVIGSFRQRYLNVWAQESSRCARHGASCGYAMRRLPVDLVALRRPRSGPGRTSAPFPDLSALAAAFRDEDGGSTLAAGRLRRLRIASRSAAPGPVVTVRAATDLESPDDARAAATAPPPRSSIVFDPDPAALRAASAPRRSSAKPSPLTPAPNVPGGVSSLNGRGVTF